VPPRAEPGPYRAAVDVPAGGATTAGGETSYAVSSAAISSNTAT